MEIQKSSTFVNPLDNSTFSKELIRKFNLGVDKFKHDKLSLSVEQKDALSLFAQYLTTEKLPLTNIELYSPILADSIIFKIRISSQSERATKFDISIFYINTESNELTEEYLSSGSVRQANLESTFFKIFSDTKAFIPFDKFNLNGQLSSIQDSKLGNLLVDFYTTNAPVIY